MTGTPQQQQDDHHQSSSTTTVASLGTTTTNDANKPFFKEVVVFGGDGYAEKKNPHVGLAVPPMPVVISVDTNPLSASHRMLEELKHRSVRHRGGGDVGRNDNNDDDDNDDHHHHRDDLSGTTGNQDEYDDDEDDDEDYRHGGGTRPFSPSEAASLLQDLLMQPEGSSAGDAPKPLFVCLLYTSPSPRDQRGSRMPSSA